MSFRVKVAAAVAVVALAVSASAMALGSGWAPPVLRLVPTPETTPTARGPGVPPSAPASTSSNTPASQSGETLFTQPNPQAQTGYLPNGVRWGVMERRGTRQVTVMFYVGAGSVNETGAEAGIAHFLEHMSVNGSTNFPADTMIPLMARLGIAFGRDQNASTGFTGTTFRLDMTEVTPQKLDLAMKWMRDIADGLTLAQTDVDKERGVILSEYNESRDPQRDVQLKIMQFLGPTLRVAQRDPIGTREAPLGRTQESKAGPPSSYGSPCLQGTPDPRPYCTISTVVVPGCGPRPRLCGAERPRSFTPRIRPF